MRITAGQWLKLQKTMSEQPASIPASETMTGMPRVIHLGVLHENGMVDVSMKLVAEAEWLEFQNIWERISGTSTQEGWSPRETPQFFLSCK